MALSRGRRYEPVNYWPGFVDALSTMLLVIIFLLSVFMLAQFFLSREVTGKDEALVRLNRQIEELTNLLALERTQKSADESKIATLTATLDSAQSDAKRLKDAAAEGAATAAAAGQASAAAKALEDQRALSARALAQVDVLNQQIAALRKQLAAIEDALSASEAANKESQSKISDLGQRLNIALAQKVQELNRYRSDFFGRLRQILGSRPDIRVVGDRFVFQSSVLFDEGKADLSPEGKQSLDTLAAAVLDLEREIPPDIPWILRVDGHTDKPSGERERPVQVELGAVGCAGRLGRAIPHLQGGRARPARGGRLRRVSADRPGDRRCGARPQPAHRTQADGAVSVSSFALRDFEEADLPALVDLWVAAWRETGFAIDFEARRPWLDQRLRAHHAGGGAIVVGLDPAGQPAGFVTLDPANGYLDQLCVAPPERGSGLASVLLDAAKSLAPGVVELDVNEDNRRARRFYEREGFRAVTQGVSAHSGLPTLRMRWMKGG